MWIGNEVSAASQEEFRPVGCPVSELRASPSQPGDDPSLGQCSLQSQAALRFSPVETMGCMFVATNVGVSYYAVVDNKIKRVKSEFLHAAHKHQSLSSPTTSKPCWTLFCGGSNLLSSLLARLPVPLSPCPLHNSTCYLAKSSLSFKVSRSLQTSSPLCNSCGQN